MRKFTDEFRKTYNRTNEEREDELEKNNLMARIENRTRQLERINYINIVEEKGIVEEIVRDYERLKYYGAEGFDNEDYEFQKRRLEKLTSKQLEISRKMYLDPSWDEFQNEELRKESLEEGEERE